MDSGYTDSGSKDAAKGNAAKRNGIIAMIGMLPCRNDCRCERSEFGLLI